MANQCLGTSKGAEICSEVTSTPPSALQYSFPSRCRPCFISLGEDKCIHKERYMNDHLPRFVIKFQPCEGSTTIPGSLIQIRYGNTSFEVAREGNIKLPDCLRLQCAFPSRRQPRDIWCTFQDLQPSDK